MGSKKIKFNVIDALIIVLIAAVIAGGVFLADKLNLIGNNSVERDYIPIRYVIEVPMLDEQYSALLEAGDMVMNSRGTVTLGEVKSCEIRDADIICSDSDGNPVVSVIEGKKDLYVTIEAEAYIEGNAYYVNGLKINVGEYVELLTPALSCAGYCISFEEVRR